MDKPLLPGWRIKLSHQKHEGLVVNAANEARAHELALQWAQSTTPGIDVTVVSCKRIPDDEIIVVKDEMWKPGK